MFLATLVAFSTSGPGDGRLLALLRIDRPEMHSVGLDLSEPMLKAARKRFADDHRIELVKHDLAEPLPALEHEDPSDRLLDVESQLAWLRELGFDDVDCYWKWLEIALLIGIKPTEAD